ncbi:MAG: hypothetical protein COA61_004325 [Zetaproteobacteria bacterium]|nr:hypothetical protein [Zetaproteobacteria bacterium]
MAAKHQKDERDIAPIQGDEHVQNVDEVKVSHWKSRLSGGHSRREWLLLGERVFSHPRYAILIVAALGLCMFERYWFVLAPLALFFAGEWMLRFWLQKENHFRNRTEFIFLMLDGLATLSLFSALFVSADILDQAVYLRIARLFRGMYMLRMLRIFAFLTFDTFIYSLPFALLVIGMVGLAIAVPSVALYMGVLLILEAACRAYSIWKVLPKGGRRNTEFGFVLLDGVSSVVLLGLMPEFSPYWVAIRAIRFLVMLNPLGNISLAAKRVAAMQEVRSETSMLAGMMVAMMMMGGLSVVYLYPQMDINDDGVTNAQDYVPVQVVLYVFRLMVDPGAATTEAFSPWLLGLTVLLVLSGVFFFALVVSLGSNVMHYMLRELSNSPLSAREYLVIVGWNEQSYGVLKRLDAMFSRMRQRFAAVWVFHDKAVSGASTVGSWLSVREVDPGSRNLAEHFKLSGVQQMIIFRRKQDIHLVDTHHLVRNFGVPVVLVSEAIMPNKLHSMYADSMGMKILDSSSITARMLYQMHHCAWMPELGIRLLDAVAGETGLYTLAWAFDVEVGQGKPWLLMGDERQALGVWLTYCFSQGVNLLAGRREDGSFVLFSDLAHGKVGGHFVDVVGLGGNTLLWSGILETNLQQENLSQKEHALKQFVWPETWDLSMLFMGWHTGLPAMIEEMALKHHKLTLHVFSTRDADELAEQLRRLKGACARAKAQCSCELKVSVHPWDGLDSEGWVGLLRGCKVMMFYPEEREGDSEDSLLELWFHEVARSLSQRKQNVKWWTPPKLMVLPRSGGNVASFEMAGMDYPLLEVDVGSPDAFHDTFMARQLLTQTRQHLYPEASTQDEKSYAFVDAMLGDAVLVEDVLTTRLVEVSAGMDWVPIYQEALARGWMLMAYVMPELDADGQTMFGLLDRSFPQPQDETGSRMHLLAGSPVMEMDVPIHTMNLLFCRRGVLDVSLDDNKDVSEDIVVAVKAEPKMEAVAKIETVVEEVVDEQSDREVVREENELAVPEEVKEGEIMNDSVWPQTADKRLLQVLKKQVQGSLELLSESSEDGLIKLTEILDMGVSDAVEEAIMAALTDLQNIDRVSQRLTNVQTCLDDWSMHVGDASQAALWEEEVAKRYVMEEERMVLKGEL